MKQKAVRFIDWAAFVALAVTGLGWFGEANGWFDPKPLKNVRDITIELRDDGRYDVKADYTVTDAPCELDPPIGIFGWAFGVRTSSLHYEPIRRGNETEQRFQGHQSMHLIVDANLELFDRMEVWTRHACENRKEPVETLMFDVRMENGSFP